MEITNTTSKSINTQNKPALPKWESPQLFIETVENSQSGQAGIFQEATFTGYDPYTLYNS